MTDTDESGYRVVRNDEEQYSIWRADRELAGGLARRGHDGHAAGMPGPHRHGVDGHAPAEPAPQDGDGLNRDPNGGLNRDPNGA